MIGRQAGERGGRNGDAVISLEPADDLLLLRTADGIVVVPDELHLAVIGFRARRAEEDLRDRYRRDLLELLGELDGRVVALAAEYVREGQLRHLGTRRFHELGIAVAERRAPQPRHALQVWLA